MLDQKCFNHKQDKRNRLYVVTALQETKIDLKGKDIGLQEPLNNHCSDQMCLLLAGLSARLGTGKGGVRMASDEMLQTVLQVIGFPMTKL